MAARGFLGAGDLYIARFVNGVPGPYVGPYECRQFEIKPNVELKEMTSKGRDTYGQIVETVAIAQPADLTVQMSEVNKESLAIALLGTSAPVNQVGTTVNNEVVSLASQGTWYSLTKHSLTGAVTVTNIAGTTTYVNGVDYLVEMQQGWIKSLPGGAIANATTVHVDFTAETTSGTEIKGMTQAQLRARFKLVGKNFADDLPFVVTVHEAVIAADSAMDFLQDDFAEISLPGRMKTPVGFTEPFTVSLTKQA
jgi:hypothetical protein